MTLRVEVVVSYNINSSEVGIKFKTQSKELFGLPLSKEFLVSKGKELTLLLS